MHYPDKVLERARRQEQMLRAAETLVYASPPAVNSLRVALAICCAVLALFIPASGAAGVFQI